MASSTENKTLLPGFGRPLNYTPQEEDPDYVEEPFPTALSQAAINYCSVAQPMTTLRELTMLQLMNSITDKKDWHIKVNDDSIADKWKAEALNSGADVTQSMVDWCIDELRYKATSIIPGTPCAIVAYDAGVVKSDLAVSSELKDELQKAVSIFEEKIPARLKDWHPGSDEKVWDLVHPSLYPLVYGQTRILENGETTLEDCINRCGEGEIVPVPPAGDTGERSSQFHPFYCYSQNDTKPYSAKFQWLPCEVDVSGTEARITTYINNLHPVNDCQLYGLISKLITASIPLWELTLASLRIPNIKQQRITYARVKYDPDPIRIQTDGPQREPDEDDFDLSLRRMEWYDAIRKVVRPEPEGIFEPPAPSTFKFKDLFAARGLQVIVKLANIELTPEKPNYEGGSWHVEGQLNEHIVATSLYYYSCENITTSTLAFRQQSNEQDTHKIADQWPQDQHDWLTEVFGCEPDGPCVQELGGVETREGRLLTFPNILQHRVGPFKLEDPTKPGHRKIIALFLVDPYIKVISTAHVPCQQRDWWWEVVRSMPEHHKSYSSNIPGVAGLPRELQDYILEQMDDADFPISLEEAKRQRLELMEERKDYVAYNGSIFESVTFSLCEH